MKKLIKKLSLKKEKIASLDQSKLNSVKGGRSDMCYESLSCLIHLKDPETSCDYQSCNGC